MLYQNKTQYALLNKLIAVPIVVKCKGRTWTITYESDLTISENMNKNSDKNALNPT